MKRFLSAAGMIVLSVLFIGCAHDTRERLIQDTINMMDSASSQVKNITDKVKDATDRYTADPKKGLDLSDAMKAADELKKVGNKALEIKQDIDRYRSKMSSEDQQANANNQKENLNKAFKKLVDRKNDLRAALAVADGIGDEATKAKVVVLREKIVEAEGPFESLTR